MNTTSLEGKALAAAWICGLLCISTTRAESVFTEQARAYIDATKKERGYVPRFGEFVTFVNNMASPPTQDDWEAACSYWRDIQKEPSIATNDLADIIEAKRESLFDGKIRFDVLYDKPASDGSPTQARRRQEEFAFLGDKLMRKWGEDSVRSGPYESAECYDGKYFKTYTIQKVLGANNSGLVTPHQGRAPFFAPESPLMLSMLMDCKLNFGMDMPAYDLVVFLRTGGYILEEQETINGTTCVVGCYEVPPLFRVYLDPARDFSVVKFDEFATRFDPDKNGGSTVVNNVRCSWLCEDFTDLGNGVWLPRKIEQSWYVDVEKEKNGATPGDAVVRKITIQTTEAAINQGVEESVFARFFPDGIVVRDEVANITYTMGGPTTIEDVMNDAVKNAVAVVSESKGLQKGTGAHGGTGEQAAPVRPQSSRGVRLPLSSAAVNWIVAGVVGGAITVLFVLQRRKGRRRGSV
jgi:hypothetical protein